VESNRRRTWSGIVCWTLAGAWALFAVARIFGWEPTWFGSTLMAFTPYIAVLSLVPVAVSILSKRWGATALATLTLLVLGTLINARTGGQADPDLWPRLRVMSTNMKIGAADQATIVGLVRSQQIDLLAIEEYTPDAESRLLAAGLGGLLPYHATHPLLGATGSAIYSRYPLSWTGYQDLAGGFGQEYATVTVPGAKPLEFWAVHTRAPTMPDTEHDWRTSIAQQPKATPKGGVRLLAGDFNATFDQTPLRTLLRTGYKDVASQVGDGLTPTWPYDGRLVPPVKITLDHIFADPRIGVVSFGASTVPRTDHRAIYASITLPAG
jgi:endonuclease/exonuclease/phosphatase (EEP) superfamily protein YafD